MSVAAARRVAGLPSRRRLLPERDELVARHPVVEQYSHELLRRPLERRDDDQVVLERGVVAYGMHRHAQKLRALFAVEDGDRLEPGLLEREVGELRRLAAPEDPDA